eukprot:CAMPEP_0171262078 /NCGR_PEP_ID=MMETSP0790-20130122/56351_1 /TAXON_ID=2925 /ORGANISM="Alexandrium catenella, Strain OF101" /LENGTH=64 /DNA_ID=CAMNT_0011730559 /DNA_START=446 /DNA_END=640 /DNA_ORIENTATION=+
MTNVEHEPQVIALVTKPDRYIAAIFVEVALDDDSHILIDECKLRQTNLQPRVLSSSGGSCQIAQ